MKPKIPKARTGYQLSQEACVMLFFIAGVQSRSEIAEAMNMKRRHVSVVIGNLRRKGFTRYVEQQVGSPIWWPTEDGVNYIVSQIGRDKYIVFCTKYNKGVPIPIISSAEDKAPPRLVPEGRSNFEPTHVAVVKTPPDPNCTFSDIGRAGVGGNMNDIERAERTSSLLDQMFTYHPPKDGQPKRYERIRAAAKEFARVVLDEAPEIGMMQRGQLARETLLALDKISEAVMHANAGIARHE